MAQEYILVERYMRQGGLVLAAGRVRSKFNRKNLIFCISTSMPAEYWYVPRVIYVQKAQPTGRLLILTW